MTGVFGWIGRRARWVLFIGAFAGLAAPDISAWLRPALPVFVAMVYALAMLRVDPLEVLRGLASPQRAGRALAVSLTMLVAAPMIAFAICRLVGLGPQFEAAVVYTLAAPPIASAAAMCLIIGYSGARALELTILCSLLMPITGPVVAEALIGADLDIDPLALGLRMAVMIFGGFAAAMIGRRILGEDRIARRRSELDGLAAVGFLLFILPLFDGARIMVLADPRLALGFLALAFVLIFAPVFIMVRFGGDEAEAGASGVVFGTRSVAIYLAALPPDPIFALYVAIYQFPMAWLPVFCRLRSRDGAS